MAPQSEALSRTAVRTATQNQVDLDATLVTSSRSLPIGNVPDYSFSGYWYWKIGTSRVSMGMQIPENLILSKF